VLRAPLADLRETLRQRVVAVLPGDTGEIAAALIMGDQRGISERAQEAMRASGLGHVLSISGLHMALVAGSAFWLLRALFALSPTLALTRPIRKWAAAGALAVATFYLAISGADVAAQRSYVMLVVILTAVMLDRRAITVRNVAIAAIVVLALEPESVLTASFQMSFAATLALVAGYEAIARRADRAANLGAGDAGIFGRARRATSGLVLTSVIAGVATAPFAIYHFQRAAPLSLAANLAAMPVVGILVMPMALFAVLLMPFGLEALALVPMGWGIDWMLAVGETTAAWSAGWGGIPAIPAVALLLVVAGFLWLCLWGERWRLAGIVPMLLAVPVALATPHPDMLVDAEGRMAAVRGADGRYRVVNPKADRFAAEYWLRADADTRSLDDDSIGEGVACDAAGCVVRLPDGMVVAVGALPEAFADDCRLASVIVSRFRAPDWCDRPDVVIDRSALVRGAYAIYRLPDAAGDEPRFRVEAALPPADRRRPFMPPAQ
jgi:competence protein ComEC